MAHTMTFDTLAFAKKLEASGVRQKQAEATAEAMKDAFEENIADNIFTQQDGKLLKAELKAEIAEVRNDLFKVKSDILMWVIGLFFAQNAIFISVMKFIH